MFGRGEGIRNSFEYNTYKPFVGLVSFEIDNRTLGLGGYEDTCAKTPKRLPFGFGTMNLPSIDELKGKHSATTMTWDNTEHGVSAQEVGLLD